MSLKIVKFDHFDVKWQAPNVDSDYSLHISVKPDYNDKDQAHFTNIPLSIIYPHTFGIQDTSINETNYSVIIIYDDKVRNVSINNFPYFICLQRKSPIAFDNVTPQETCEATQDNSEKITKNYRNIKSPDGSASLSIGENCIDQNVKGTRQIISSNGFKTYGITERSSLPTDSYGGFFEDTGFMHFVPDIPPFGQIKVMPSTKGISKSINMVNSSLKLLKILKGML